MALDLTGKRFGRLVAQRPVGKLKNNAVVWKCLCDCGNIVNVPIGNLNSREHTRSCGCLNLDPETTKKRKESRKKYNVDGTCTHQLKRNKKNKNNSSGITGVTQDRRTGKWKAQIIFKRKHYYLGTYDKIEDAADARAMAEKKIFGKFLEWYENEWRKEHDKC